jgi:hypothetical protein
MAQQGASSARLPAPSDSDESQFSYNSEPALSVNRRQQSGKRLGEATPLMLDVPGHFRDLPLFLDTAERLKSGRWKAMMEAVVSKARSAQWYDLAIRICYDSRADCLLERHSACSARNSL